MRRSSSICGLDAARDARKLLQPIQPHLRRLLQALIRTNTVAIPPSGNETAGQIVLRDFLSEQSVTAKLYELESVTRFHHRPRHRDRNYVGRKNLIARIGGSGRGKSLLLNGHMDTVPPGKTRWSDPPWSARLRNGRMYGLGSFDMKGGLTAQAGVLCALKRAGLRLGGDVILESVVDEEWGGGSGTVAGRLRGDSADACVIAEGTQLQIFRATRGGFVVDLITEAGDPKGYFSNKEVLSPAVPLGRLLGLVDSWTKRRSKQTKAGAYAKFPDPAPVQVLAVESNRFDPEIPLSVPLRASVRVYFQFLPQENVAAIIERVRRSLEDFVRRDPFFRVHGVRWIPVVDPPLLGHELSESHPWTRCLIESAGACLGKTPVVTAAPYPCDAFLIHREAGIPTLLFGPRGAGAHNPDEYVEVKSVMQTTEILLAATLQWCDSN
jgi:acetylornithine deacetylase